MLYLRFALIALFCALAALGCGGKSPEELLQKAQELGQKGDVIGMRVTCEKIISQAPDSPEAYKARMVLAQVEAQGGNLDKARKHWAVVFEKAGLDERMGRDAYMSNLQSYAMEKKFDEALKVIAATSETLSAHPQMQLSAEHFKALMYSDMGDYDKAISVLESLREKSDSPGLAFRFTEDIVNVYIARKEFAQAADTLKAALDKAESLSTPLSTGAPKKFAQSNMQLVDLYKKAEQIDKAIDHLLALRNKSQSEDEFIAINEQIVGVLNSEKRYLDAVKLYSEYLDKYPEGKVVNEAKSGIALFYKNAATEEDDESKAESYSEKSEEYFQEAESALKKRLQDAVLDQEKIQAAKKLASSYQLMGMDEEAIETYEFILNNTEKSQSWIEALQKIAIIYINDEDFEKAISTMRTMQNRFPNAQNIQVNAEKTIKQLEQNLADKENFEATSKTVESLPKLPEVDAPGE